MSLDEATQVLINQAITPLKITIDAQSEVLVAQRRQLDLLEQKVAALTPAPVPIPVPAPTPAPEPTPVPVPPPIPTDDPEGTKRQREGDTLRWDGQVWKLTGGRLLKNDVSTPDVAKTGNVVWMAIEGGKLIHQNITGDVYQYTGTQDGNWKHLRKTVTVAVGGSMSAAERGHA